LGSHWEPRSLRCACPVRQPSGRTAYRQCQAQTSAEFDESARRFSYRTTTIPIVNPTVIDSINFGLVQSPPRPQGRSPAYWLGWTPCPANNWNFCSKYHLAPRGVEHYGTPACRCLGTQSVFSVAFSSDRGRVLSGGDKTVKKLWDTATGVLIRTFDIDQSRSTIRERPGRPSQPETHHAPLGDRPGGTP
jgi:WD40 repeat protein